MRFLVLLIVGLLTTTTAQAVPHFDFQGVRLGITLDEFKQDANWRKARCKTSVPYEGMTSQVNCMRSGMFNLEPFSGTTVIGFRFLLAPDGAHRLATISILTHVSNATEATAALMEKFRSKPTVSRNTATNALGAPLETLKITWNNDDGTEIVVISAPCDKVDRMCLEYANVSMLKDRVEELNQAMRAKAKRY